MRWIGIVGLAVVLGTSCGGGDDDSLKQELVTAKALARPFQPRTELGIPIPAVFEANVGQARRPARFVSRRRGGELALTDAAAVATLVAFPAPAPRRGPNDAPQPPRRDRVSMEFVGADADVEPRALRPLRAWGRYVTGDGPMEGPLSLGAVYEELWPGIDLRFSGETGAVRYELRVGPRADVASARFRFPEARRLSLGPGGELILELTNGRLVHTPPRFFERVDGASRRLRGRFVIGDDNEVGFQVAGRTPGADLVIDPEILFSTYLEGPTGTDFTPGWGEDIAVTAPGVVFLTSEVISGGALSENGHLDVMVMRLDLSDPANAAVDWLTVIGDDGDQYVRAMAARPLEGGGEELVLAGGTRDPFEPVAGTAAFGPIPPLCCRGIGLVMALDGAGVVQRAVQMSGHLALDLAFDDTAAGDADVFLAGLRTSDGGELATDGAFLTVPGFRTTSFVARLAPALDELRFLTYLNEGNRFDRARGIAVRDGVPTVVGATGSPDFPATSVLGNVSTGPCDDYDDAPCPDTYVARLLPDGSDLEWALRRAEPERGWGNAIAVGADGAAVVGGARGIDLEDVDAEALVLSPDGVAIPVARRLGGNEREWGDDVGLDPFGQIHLVGSTRSPDLATLGAVDDTLGGPEDGFLATLDAAGTTLGFSYFGGDWYDRATRLAIDSLGCLYLLGFTHSDDFPVVNPLPGGEANAAEFGQEAWLALVCGTAPPAPELSFVKTGTPAGSVAVGSEVLYEVRVVNEGSQTLHDVVIVDQLPEGVELVSVSGSNCTSSAASDTVTCTLGDVPPGIAGITIRVRPTTLGEFCNRATLASDRGTAEASTCHNAVNSLVVVEVDAPAFEIDKQASASEVAEGDTFTFTITVTNTGEIAATEVALTDVLPQGLSFVSAAPDGCELERGTRTVRCDLGSLDAGQSRSVQIRVRALDPGLACNQASVSTPFLFGEITGSSPARCVTVEPGAPACRGFREKCTSSDQCCDGLVCAHRGGCGSDCWLFIFCSDECLYTIDAFCSNPNETGVILLPVD